MSREFGDYVGGFFHEKIERAARDAEGGWTRGAGIMAAFLEPLAEIAWYVSSEEASDSCESGVVQTVLSELPRLRDAVLAAERYTEPAKEAAVNAVANVIEHSLEVTADDSEVRVALPVRCNPATEYLSEAVALAASRRPCVKGRRLMLRSIRSTAGVQRVYTFTDDEEAILRDKVRDLERELAYARCQQ